MNSNPIYFLCYFIKSRINLIKAVLNFAQHFTHEFQFLGLLMSTYDCNTTVCLWLVQPCRGRDLHLLLATFLASFPIVLAKFLSAIAFASSVPASIPLLIILFSVWASMTNIQSKTIRVFNMYFFYKKTFWCTHVG